MLMVYLCECACVCVPFLYNIIIIIIAVVYIPMENIIIKRDRLRHAYRLPRRPAATALPVCVFFFCPFQLIVRVHRRAHA